MKRYQVYKIIKLKFKAYEFNKINNVLSAFFLSVIILFLMILKVIRPYEMLYDKN